MSGWIFRWPPLSPDTSLTNSSLYPLMSPILEGGGNLKDDSAVFVLSYILCPCSSAVGSRVTCKSPRSYQLDGMMDSMLIVLTFCLSSSQKDCSICYEIPNINQCWVDIFWCLNRVFYVSLEALSSFDCSLVKLLFCVIIGAIADSFWPKNVWKSYSFSFSIESSF